MSQIARIRPRNTVRAHMLPLQRAQRLIVHFKNHAVRQLEGKTPLEALVHDLLRQILFGAILRLALLRQLQ